MSALQRHLSCHTYLVMPVGASDFPHSRQEALDREVINPQNGHILCAWTSRVCRFRVATSFLNKSVIKASGFINPPSLSPIGRELFGHRQKRPE